MLYRFAAAILDLKGFDDPYHVRISTAGVNPAPREGDGVPGGLGEDRVYEDGQAAVALCTASPSSGPESPS